MPVVREYLASTGTELWLLQNTDGAVIGFMGMAGAQMESLFLAPDFHRQGLARAASRRACESAPR